MIIKSNLGALILLTQNISHGIKNAHIAVSGYGTSRLSECQSFFPARRYITSSNLIKNYSGFAIQSIVLFRNFLINITFNSRLI